MYIYSEQSFDWKMHGKNSVNKNVYKCEKEKEERIKREDKYLNNLKLWYLYLLFCI